MISDIHAIIFSTAPTPDCRQDIISQAIYRHPGLPLNPFRSSRYQASEVGICRTRSAFRATDRSIILQPEHNSFKRSTSNDTCRHFDFNFQKQSATTNNSNKRYRKRETLSLSSILLPPHYYPPRCIVDKQFFFFESSSSFPRNNKNLVERRRGREHLVPKSSAIRLPDRSW